MKDRQRSKKSTKGILAEHPLWSVVDRNAFCKRFFISEELYEAVHIAIYRYDPMGLAHLTPDEYDMEIIAACSQIDKRLFHTNGSAIKGVSVQEVVEIVKKVFGDFFGEEYVTEDVFTIEACEAAAKDIFEAIKVDENYN